MSANEQTWLITGVSSGFGRALAEEVLARGHRVLGSVRREADAAAFEALAPGRAMALQFDVTDEPAVHAAVGKIVEQGMVIDVLVNNAGYGLVAGVEEASLEETRQQFEVNVYGPLIMMQAVLPSMRARRSGAIINITSVSGIVGWPSLGIYTGSKFALEGISETLAQELAPLGIRVMMVEPGGFRTNFATTSRNVSTREITDYDASVGECRRILASHRGHEPGDPAKAARAILTALEAPEPPLRLLLGEDALGYARGKLDQQLGEIAQWEALTLSTNYTLGNADGNSDD